MGLSDRERQMLREIELSLLAEDPQFGKELQGASSISPRTRFIGVVGVALGLLGLVTGVALSQVSLWFVTLSAIGFVIMFLSAVWLLRGTSGQPTAATLDSIDRPAKPSSRTSGSGIGDKMERRFRDRFEDR